MTALHPTPICLLRSTVAGRRPGDGTFRPLQPGEVMLNLADGVQCWLDASGALRTTPLLDLATHADVTAAAASVVAQIEGGAASALDTLRELGDALGNKAAKGANGDITRLTGLTARPAWGGLTPWDSGNFNPSLYGPLSGANFASLSVNGNFVWTGGNFNPANYASLSGASFGSLAVNGAGVWHAGNFDPASKITGDAATTLGFNGGNIQVPYMSGPGGYRQLIWNDQDATAIGISSTGALPYIMHDQAFAKRFLQSTDGANDHIQYFAGNQLIWQVDATAFPVSHGTPSDRRLKTIDGPVTEAVARVAALKPVIFEYNDIGRGIGAPPNPRPGFVADELAKVLPSAVEGFTPLLAGDDAGVSYDHLSGDATVQICALLVASHHELLARLEAAEARIAQLEGRLA